ncbi:MAG TPA: hypothetical protein VJZ77_19155 [Blastocatellia bacterium]|nr:hypothetical protein [Blastocatellia bacterium]
MQRHITTSIFLALICGLMARGQQAKPAQNSREPNTAAIKVYPARGKRIRIVAGTERTLVDLTDDVSGCLELFDPTISQRRTRQPLRIKVIDRVRKDDKYYLVLLTSAQSNCNVQGYCGAATDITLIWLKLAAGLKLEEKQSAVIVGCRTNIDVADPQYDKRDELVIKLVRGRLAIEYGNTLDDDVQSLSQLVYDRKFPERGFVMTTKEKKPKQEQ